MANDGRCDNDGCDQQWAVFGTWEDPNNPALDRPVRLCDDCADTWAGIEMFTPYRPVR